MELQPLNILVLEDDPIDTEIMLRELRRAGLEPDWLRVDNEKDYLANLNADLDLIISDFQMPQFNGLRALELLKRPNLTYADLMAIPDLGPGLDDQTAAQQIEIQVKYAGYITRQEDEIAKLMRQETLKIPTDVNYQTIAGLSAEAQQKLAASRPETIGMASRIPGMTPAAISLLLVHLKKRKAS